MDGDHTDEVGLNPYRKHVVRRADLVVAALAAVACIALVAWAFLG
jgi:hypothetical protein